MVWSIQGIRYKRRKRVMLRQYAEEEVNRLSRVGDARQVAKAMDAIHEGFEAARAV